MDTLGVPETYLNYLAGGAPREGFANGEPGYFHLWEQAELEVLGREYGVSDNLPSLIGFGTNGGGELLAFDSLGQVVMVPLITLCEEDVRLVAESWEGFLAIFEPAT